MKLEAVRIQTATHCTQHSSVCERRLRIAPSPLPPPPSTKQALASVFDSDARTPPYTQREMITVMIHACLTWFRQSTLMALVCAGCLQYS